MKKSLKLMTLSMCAVLFSTTVVGCNPEGVTPPDGQDPNKYNLTVGVYNGGFGGAWADTLKIEFEEYFKDLELGDGRKGVSVLISDDNKGGFDSASLAANLQAGTYDYDVVCTSSAINSLMKENDKMFMDITDAYTEKVYDQDGNFVGKDSGTVALVDRVEDYYVNAFNFGTEEAPQFLALPYEDTYQGFVYDHDLFEQEGWLNYSGYQGTPKTVSEFLDLLSKIRVKYTPFTVSNGDASFYWQAFMCAFMAQYEGEENALLNISLDGDYTFDVNYLSSATLADLDADMYETNADGSVTVHITPENGWILREQPGKVKLAELLKEIFRPENVDPGADVTGFDIAKMHENFVYSPTNEYAGKRIAMIYEGEWWENESRAYFNNLDKRPATQKYGWGDRDFRYMPVPQADGGVNDGYYMYSKEGTATFMNSYTTKNDQYKKEVAKLWLQFMYSRRGAAVFTMNAGGVFAVDYRLTADEQKACTPFVRSTYIMKKESDVKTLRCGNNSPYMSDYTKNTTLPMTGYPYYMSSKYNSINYNHPANYFDCEPGATVQDWKSGYLANFTKEKWLEAYNTYLKDFAD